ncbi:MAG: AAA family ATPase [Deltaproteobacteria bacterium]|nr:AAA family ATPase [Deltaproteobacteria bacterium]
METIRIRVKRTSYLNRDNGYVVFKGDSSRRPVTAVGYLPEALDGSKLSGIDFELTGAWEMSKFGRQFAFSKARLISNQMFYFLAKVVSGVGDKLAVRLLEHYGEKKLVAILEHEPEKLLEFKGIKEKKLSQIKTSWEKQKKLRALSEFLLPHGITPNLLVRIFNSFGDDAARKVRDTPYSLTEIRGIGFKTADGIARKLGLPYTAPERIEAAIYHLLLEAGEQDGHTYLQPETLYRQLDELLQDEEAEKERLDRKIFIEVIERLFATNKLVLEGNQRVALKAFHYVENYLKNFFLRKSEKRFAPLLTTEGIDNFIAEQEKRLNFQLAPQQRRAVAMIGGATSRLYALSGYAGTGKSTISRTILDLLGQYFCERREIVCCAFTGMAAARIRKLTGYQAYTIHALLKYQGDNRFEHDRDRPLPYKVILLDEAGMVNSQIFYRLALAIPETTLLIMVGDPAQLPPIGAGNVFADILNKSWLNRISLDQIFRQSEDSVLVYFANLIRTGEIPPDYERHYQDFVYIKEDIPNYFQLKKELPEKELQEIRNHCNEKIRELILELARKAVSRLQFPTWDFQVLTPVRRGPLGTEVLNHQLQQVFNPRSPCQTERFGTTFKVDDKVVHLQNKDMECASYHSGCDLKQLFSWRRQRIFNGYVGIIKEMDLERELFYVVYPGPLAVRYNFDHIRDIIDLAYCLTVHKAQGSQYKYVAIPLSNSHFMMLNNKWFYTAITRAEKKVYLVGQEFALKRGCTNSETMLRNTFLALTETNDQQGE